MPAPIEFVALEIRTGYLWIAERHEELEWDTWVFDRPGEHGWVSEQHPKSGYEDRGEGFEILSTLLVSTRAIGENSELWRCA